MLSCHTVELRVQLNNEPSRSTYQQQYHTLTLHILTLLHRCALSITMWYLLHHRRSSPRIQLTSLFLCSLPLCLLCISGGFFNGWHSLHLLWTLQEGSFHLGNYI